MASLVRGRRGRRWHGLWSVERASDREAAPSLVQDVGVNHSRADVAVAEEFLNRPDVDAILKQVGGETVSHGVAAGGLGDPGSANGVPHRFLNDRLMKVVPSALAGGLVDAGQT